MDLYTESGDVIRQGDRVAILPHADLWMRGVRYGVVEKVGRKYVHVYSTLHGCRLKIAPQLLSMDPLPN